MQSCSTIIGNQYLVVFAYCHNGSIKRLTSHHLEPQQIDAEFSFFIAYHGGSLQATPGESIVLVGPLGHTVCMKGLLSMGITFFNFILRR